MQIQFNTIFFGFLKTLLLITIICSGLLYAGTLYINPQTYQFGENAFPPYHFEINPVTNELYKVFDLDNDFQFKTYDLKIAEDIAGYKEDIEPILSKWGAFDINFGPSEASHSSKLSTVMSTDVNNDLEYSETSLTPMQQEVHVALYKGEVEAIAYTDNTVGVTPQIRILVANPEGLVGGQTTIVKGGGSSLLGHIVRRYQEAGVDRIELESGNSGYYMSRGWKNKVENTPQEEDFVWDLTGDSESEGACGTGSL
ncbi:hypothetical protein THERMOT_82 [Bathymodiolus thermophilus thioautotrophic gill symbiont]|uniref:Uncharacterized protein n=1 Tax=Bathymodiolus thermophilus thioautotrophic gill symbiont TaxID=2360 RepID=A0A1J5TVG8_9GAMM|nr:hypothetical protein BGC33_09495 [Bathymodiolus thermophilus thioautotrophic gill symbiont]CAB5494295.1 hypothetical protein THERMOT_82 [Bathymodiolus thermophilus thioautotrophic gill symbiont]